MHSRLTLDQQQHLHQHLQHLNNSANFNHFLEKCRCTVHHQHHQHPRQQQHQLQNPIQQTLQQTQGQLIHQTYQYHQQQQRQQHHQHHHHYQGNPHQLQPQYHPHSQTRHTQQPAQQYLHSHRLSGQVLSALTNTHQQLAPQHKQHSSIAHHLYHHHHPHTHHPHHHHPQYHQRQTLVASVSANCSSIAAAAVAAAASSCSQTQYPSPPTSSPSASPATLATPPTPTPTQPAVPAAPALAACLPSSHPANISTATMYRRHQNLSSYCGVGSQEPGQNYQVQYVDTDLYHSNSSQSQMTYPFCPIGDYQPNGQSYYTTTHTPNYSTAVPLNAPTVPHPSTLPYIVPTEEALLLNASSQTHSRDSPHSLTEVAFIPDPHSTSQTPTSTTANSVNVGSIGPAGGSSGGSDVSPDNDHGLMGNSNKIASATIKWLSRNYETAEGVSLPRSTLYNHYIQHCNESKIEPVNAASFGKLIRSVFSGLRTRRLGTRGNSKYHYYGIRIKPESILNHMMDEKPAAFQTHHLNPANLGPDPHNSMVACSSSSLVSSASSAHVASNNNNNVAVSNSGAGLHINRCPKKAHSFKSETHEACGHFLGDGSGAIPSFPPIELDNTFDSELTSEDVETFRSMYREHCENFLDAVLNLDFNTIEFLWRDFWRENPNLDECGDEEKYLSKTKLYLLCHCAGVQKFVREIDYQFYQNMVDVIIPDVLRSIPNSLTQAIRNFAKNMEIWLCESMIGVPERMVQIKSSAVSAFCQTLRRYTSLNHLAQAARAVLQNSSQITQMLNDLNRVDFHNVQEQAAWVCQCEPSLVQRLENDFKTTLQQQCSLEQWATWLQVVVDSVLQEHFGKPSYAKAARQFLLKWSFYSSMIIRDLTLRSASSFGSFHLIRLLYDEYMFYLIEHKVAEAHQKTAIAVICDLKQKEVEFDFGYQLEFITNDTLGPERPGTKRLKHE
ncbi:DNA-binding protein RFX2 [Stomoxys calcitrans]|uniref:DNA-binding protein RFX2 n=1 Tax=Stomoxys calcitrans TaxID=35570 RepID=UPI0027E269BA|nr:DNA-binding protein RFX2 [Stomoxys calcitrans]